MEEKFFVRFKMAFFVQDGRQFLNGYNFGPNSYFFVLSFALCLNLEKEKIVEEVFWFRAEDGATCPRGWLKIVFLS